MRLQKPTSTSEMENREESARMVFEEMNEEVAVRGSSAVLYILIQ